MAPPNPPGVQIKQFWGGDLYEHLSLLGEVAAFGLYGSVGDLLPNDSSRAPKMHGGVKGYLSVM
jgi:hypothetical protein